MSPMLMYLLADRRNVFSWISRGVITPPSLMLKYRDDDQAGAPDAVVLRARADMGRPNATQYPVACELRLDVPPAADVSRQVLTGALSAARVVRLLVPTEADRAELVARSYRGFDPARFEVAVEAGLFEGPVGSPNVSTDVLEVAYDDALMRRREAVAGALAGTPSQLLRRSVLQSSSADPFGAIVEAAGNLGLISDEGDLRFFGVALEAVFASTEAHDLVPSGVVETLRQSLPKEDPAQRYLDRIGELLRGEAEAEFKPGGLRSGKALALFLLSPGLESLGQRAQEGTGVEPEVLMLAGLFAGLAARYGGLAAEMRSPKDGPLLDWVAAGLTPNGLASLVRPEQLGESVEPAVVDAAPALSESLLAEVAAGDHARAIALAGAAGWVDCLRLHVVADDCRTFAQGRRVRVEFAAGATIEWVLVPDAFGERVGGLVQAELETLLAAPDPKRPRTSTVRRASKKGAASKPAATRSGDPGLPAV